MVAGKRISFTGLLPDYVPNTLFTLWSLTVIATLVATGAVGLGFLSFVFSKLAHAGVTSNPLNWVDGLDSLRAAAAAAVFAVICHMVRLKILNAQPEVIRILFPHRLTVETETGDHIIDKFRYQCRIAVDAYDREMISDIGYRVHDMQRHLEAGLRLAVSDPVARYSKEKMERILRMSLGDVFDLKRVAGIEILDIRAVRM